MRGYVTDWRGREWLLPYPTQWELEYTAGVPCDSFTFRCPWEMGGERRWLPVCAPGGYSWQPGAGDKVLVLKAGVERESPYILGKIQENVEEAGPIRLFGPGSALGLDQGRVELEGTVYLNGQTLEAYIQKIVAEMLG